MTSPDEFFDVVPPARLAGGPGGADPDTEARRPGAATLLPAAAPLFDLAGPRPRLLLERGLDLLLAAVGAQRGFLLRLDAGGGLLESCRRGFAPELGLGGLLADAEGPLRDVRGEDRVRVTTDPAVAAEGVRSWGEAGRGVRAFLCVRVDAPPEDPAEGGRELWLPPPATGPGRLLLYADVIEPGRSFAPRAGERAREAAEVLRRALERHARLARLQYDADTGLLSRGAFQHALERALATGPAPVALLFADVDGWDEGRRRHGEGWAEETLRRLAETFVALLPGSALAGRWGPDQVVACLPATAAGAAAARAEEMRRAFAEATGAVAERGARVSIGVAIAPDERSVALELLRRAEQAAAAGGQAGGDRWLPWSADLPPLSARLDALAGLFATPALDLRRAADWVLLAQLGPRVALADAVPPEALDLLGRTLLARRILLLSAGPDGALRVVRARAAGAETDPAAPFARALALQCVRDRTPSRWSGTEAELLESAASPATEGRLSILLAPIVTGDAVAGVLCLETAAPAGFGAADADHLESAAALFAARVAPDAGPRAGTPGRGPA